MVESDSRATSFAAANLVEWVGARAIMARVDRYLASLSSERWALRAATVVLDPPRAGAGLAVVDALAKLRVAQLIYVACDPVAFARDVGLFLQRGYRLEALSALDLFPNTYHFETVAQLVIDN